MSDAGQIIGTIVGGVFGFAVGGPAGAFKGASLGYSLTQSKQNKSPTYGFSSTYNTKSQKLPIPIVYGENKVAGNTIFEDISGSDNQNIALQIAVSEGPIKAINYIKANDIDINSDSTVKLGTRTQTAHRINNKGQTFPYTAYISTELKAGDKISGNPTITSIVKGRKIEVWDNTNSQWVTQYSQNPAWCLLDFLTNTRYGLGINKDNIDLQSFKDVAVYCDETVDGESRFKLDYVLDSKKSSFDYIQEILATFRGMLLYSAGELRLKVDSPEAPVQSFTMDNIVKDSFSYSKSSKDERYNQVTILYTDPAQNWAQVGAQYSDDSDIAKRGLIENEFELLGVNRFSQAGRQARFFQKKSKYCNTFCSFKAGIDSIHCEVGDIISVSHDVPGWVDKEFRIFEIAEEENDEMRITAQEYHDAIYSDDGVVEQITDDTTLPNPFEKPDSVQNLDATEIVEQRKDGTTISKVQVFFDKPQESLFWKFGNVYYRKLDSNTETWGQWNFECKIEESGYVFDSLEEGTYEIKLVSENKNDIKEDFANAPVVEINVKGKTNKPDKIQFEKIYWGADYIKITWQPHPDDDFDEYEIRLDDNFGIEDEI